MDRRPVWVAAGAAAAAVTAVTLRAGGDFAVAGPGGPAQSLTVAAGLALVAVAAVGGPPAAGRAPAAWAAAGLGWLVAEWANPAAPGALAFTAGLLATGSFLPLFLPAVLPPGLSATGRAAVLLPATAGCLLAGPAAAVAADPRSQGCTTCPADLVAAWPSGPASTLAQAGSLGLAVAAAAGLRPVLGRRNARAARILAGLAVAAAGVDAVVAAVDGPGTAAGHAARAVLAAVVLTLAAVELGTTVRARRALRAVARAALRAAARERGPGVERLLRTALADPGLTVAYPDAAGWADSSGAAVDLAGRAPVLLTDDGVPVTAVLTGRRRPGDRAVVTAALDGVRLQLDVERIEARQRARVRELRLARRRVVEAAWTTRVRLERDLHDGAQQRLVALRFGLGVVRSMAERRGALALLRAVEEADALADGALGRVRELAHAMTGASSGTGLADAVRDAADRAGAEVVVPDDPAVAEADPVTTWLVQAVVEELLAGADQRERRVVLRRTDGCVVVQVCGRLPSPGLSALLHERLTLLGGTTAAGTVRDAAGDRHETTVVIPCS